MEECGWKGGDSSNSAGRKNIVQRKNKRTHLTPTGLLMEGDYTHNPVTSESGFILMGKSRPNVPMASTQSAYGRICSMHFLHQCKPRFPTAIPWRLLFLSIVPESAVVVDRMRLLFGLCIPYWEPVDP